MSELALTQVGDLYKKLTPDSIEYLAGFVSLYEFLENLKIRRWDGKRELDEIIAIASQGENLGAKLGAIKYLRELLYDAAKASGCMVTATKTFIGPDGSTLKFTAELVAAAVKGKTDAIQRIEEIGKHSPPVEDNRDLFPGISCPAGRTNADKVPCPAEGGEPGDAGEITG